MTVSELIRWLQEFDGDAEVVIAEYQDRGSDFAYDIGDVSNTRYSNWDDDDDTQDDWDDDDDTQDDWDDDDSERGRTCVQIVLGSQIGTMTGDDGDVMEW